MDEVKRRSRKGDSEKKEDLKRSHHERDNEKERETKKHRDWEKKGRESGRLEIEKSTDSDEKYYRDKHRERENDRGSRDDKKRRDKKRKYRDSEDRGRERGKEEKNKEMTRDKEREREKREHERGREKEIERESCLRETERHHEVHGDDSGDDTRERDRKRHRRHDYKEEREKSSKVNMHKDGSEDGHGKKVGEDVFDKKEKKTREEELEDEELSLDEQMEKRRRRVQEWQELRRKTEESEMEKCGKANAGEPESAKTWILDGESDDEEVPPTEKPIGCEVEDAMAVDDDSRAAVSTSQSMVDSGVEEDEIDPLDAFMNSVVLPEVEKQNKAVAILTVDDKNSDPKSKDKKENQKNGPQPKRASNKSIGRMIPGEDSDSDYEDLESDGKSVEDEDDDKFMKRVKKTKVEKLAIVDHSKIDYQLFRKNFYIEVREISRMTPEEVAAYRKQLELKIHGKDVPKPIKTWNQTGLTTKLLEKIKKLNFEKPMPIQAQALPIIMSGRDCIGVAKTGSGKTLAFVLPMLRHIKDQPPVLAGDGPIGLIMAPTRELVQQIHCDIKKFARVLGIRCVPVYGGSGVAQQISELKRGTEIVVCTPGRMIDILHTSGGKITNLHRVTFFVMDEADRMFDLGFEPQITRIVQNIRPDRQTVLFSATFPHQVEILARKVLTKPVEIQVGGRSVVNKDITQLVEIRPESDRFLRLLELLGEWSEKGKSLIFVHSQDKCDTLFKDLLKRGYPCLSLHGGKDQADRESTISDFKNNICNLLVGTSIAARGLDVKDLELVVNYDVPNHYEDYVHRVGRTGRAGQKGCAITFLSEDDARFAPDLVKALKLSDQAVPDDLKALADGFMAKVNQGLEQAHRSGYGGRGFKFNEEEDEMRKAAQAREYGFEVDKSDSEDEYEDEDVGVQKAGGDLTQLPVSVPGVLGISVSGAATVVSGSGLPVPVIHNDVAARFTAAIHNLTKIQADSMPEHCNAALEINDFPQNARWRVTQKDTLSPISDWSGASITTRGQYFPPGKLPGAGEHKLFLFIQGPSDQSVKRAKAELKRVLEDITKQAASLPGGAQPGRYSVV